MEQLQLWERSKEQNQVQGRAQSHAKGGRKGLRWAYEGPGAGFAQDLEQKLLKAADVCSRPNSWLRLQPELSL